MPAVFWFDYSFHKSEGEMTISIVLFGLDFYFARWSIT